jgi:hypothetical protein
MNMLELLNPVHESLDWDGGRRRQLQAAATGEHAAATTGGAEAAAMSLMLLGQDEKASAEKTAVVTPLPIATLCFSNLNIAAGPSADDAHAFTEGLSTPLPATAATSHQPTGTSSAGNISSTTGFSAALSSAPHLSPVADKLHHIGSWSSRDAEMSHVQQHQQSPYLQQWVQSKRPRYERSTPRLPSKIEDLFSESQLQPSRTTQYNDGTDTIAKDDDTCTDEAVVIATRDEHGAHLGEDSYSLAATTTGHYCAVTGCLRIAQHMEKCTVHKGMKLCCMSGCFRPVQSRGFCKSHGGGARCNFNGCAKSSQGGGFCRAHGGGKRCLHEGCEKGTQRNGYCYLHGGVRSCTVDGCDKKDRGNGKCFSHGGGRKCQSPLCFTTIRRGVYCDSHNSKLAKKL